MSDGSRLEWVSKNRRRESDVKRIGAQIAGLVASLERQALPVEEAVARVAEVVDDEFRELCRIEGIKNGVLRVGVAEVSATSNLSRKWSGRLREALPAKLKIRRVSFTYGTRGYRID